MPTSSQTAPVSAKTLLEEVRECTRAGQVRRAQKLVKEAVARYPEDAGLRKAHRVLAGERAHPRPATGRSLRGR